MSIRSLVNAAIQSINSDVSCTRKRSTGYITKPGGVRVPTYSDETVVVQPQALSFGDLAQIDSLNIQGTRRAIYAPGVLSGLIRVGQKGGDVLVFPAGTFPEGDIWLCVHVLEQWSDWCKIVITLQDGG